MGFHVSTIHHLPVKETGYVFPAAEKKLLCFLCSGNPPFVLILQRILDSVCGIRSLLYMLHGGKVQNILSSPLNVTALNTTEWGSHTFTAFGNYSFPMTP